MLALLGWILLALVVAGALCGLALVVLPAGEQIAPALRDEPLWALPPERSLAAADIDTVRLPVALRGYRFAETDQLLDRLAEELRRRDEIIGRLGGVPLATTVQPTSTTDETTGASVIDDAPDDDVAYRPRD